MTTDGATGDDSSAGPAGTAGGGTGPAVGLNGLETERLPFFSGADRLLKLIGAVYQRPRTEDRPRLLGEVDGRWGPVVERHERSGRKGLPMICLVRPAGHANLLPAIHDLLTNAKPHGVRHAFPKLGGGAAETTESPNAAGRRTASEVIAVRDLLRLTRTDLAGGSRFSESRLRFPLSEFLDWLMKLPINTNDSDWERGLRKEVQKKGVGRQITRALQGSGEYEPPDTFWWTAAIGILRVLTLLWFRVRVTGRVPVMSGMYRWFLTQPHLAPEMSGNFVRFAGRLTQSEWGKEAPEYVARLLVNVFLEDLRRSYTIPLWQVWRKRRTTYPVLLLDNVTHGNGGYALLDLINNVRNQVGQFDPLLVVSASRQVPPDAERITQDGQQGAARPKYYAESAIDGYRA